MYDVNDTNIEHRCHICNKTSSIARALRTHIYHNHECARKFKCTLREKAFKRAQHLREHTSVHTGEVLYTCPDCPMTFFSNANMYKHRQRLHRAEWEADHKKPIPPNIVGQAKQGSKLVQLKRSTVNNIAVITQFPNTDILQFKPSSESDENALTNSFYRNVEASICFYSGFILRETPKCLKCNFLNYSKGDKAKNICKNFDLCKYNLVRNQFIKN